MSIKSKLLEEIKKKTKKIREKRIEAASNKTLEAAVFDFFNNAEESRRLHGGSQYDPTLVETAKFSLENRLRAFDPRVKVTVEYTVSEDFQSTESQWIRGVTIWWSVAYIKANNVSPSLYIDVSQMLIF